MRTLVKRTKYIPHGGLLYIDQQPGQPGVVWLDEVEFSASEADRIEAELNGPGRQLSAE